jgi:hypothetical protein
MSETFQRPNTPALTKIVDTTLTGDYGSYDAMKEALRNSLDLPSPASETMSMPPRPTMQQEAAASLDPSKQSHMRVIYPFGNSRFELYSDSEDGLDAQEARIRAMYPQQ